MMTFHRIARGALILGLSGTLAACGGGLGNMFSRPASENPNVPQERVDPADARAGTIWDLFDNRDDPNTTVEVNRYIWQAALEVLDFLPMQSVDPFSGVFVTGFGTPPGGGQAYRAVVHVTDPALDARSLTVALATRSGPVSAQVQRAIEDAILTRARQLRIQARGL